MEAYLRCGNYGAVIWANHAFRSRRGAAKRSRATPRPSASPLPDQQIMTPSGIFLRDTENSDMVSYDRSLKLLKLGRLERLTATQLIEGIQVEQTLNTVVLKFLTVVPFFNVAERYHLNETVSIPRRDLRPGVQRAHAWIAKDGALHLSSTWNEPNSGSLDEVLKYREDGSLEYISTLKVHAAVERTRQVFCKVDEWNPRFSWNPLEALKYLR